jgi:hypothetical protein
MIRYIDHPTSPSLRSVPVQEITLSASDGRLGQKSAEKMIKFGGCFGGCSFSTFVLFRAMHCKDDMSYILMKIN